MKLYPIVLLLAFCCGRQVSVCAQKQVDLQKKVMLKNQVGKKYVFDRSTDTFPDVMVTVQYLGKLRTDSGRIYKIVNRSTVWGPNHHTTGAIWVYDSKNEYVGKYQLSDKWQVPVRISNNQLVFTGNKYNGCDLGVERYLGFTKGIPQEFFLKCKGEFGDIYSFHRNDN